MARYGSSNLFSSLRGSSRSKSDSRTASVTVLENTMFDTPISNFSIAKNPKSDSFQSYFLTDGSMWTIEGEKRTRFGRVEGNGKLIPTDNAQAGWTVWWRGARYVEATPYMVRIWY